MWKVVHLVAENRPLVLWIAVDNDQRGFRSISVPSDDDSTINTDDEHLPEHTSLHTMALVRYVNIGGAIVDSIQTTFIENRLTSIMLETRGEPVSLCSVHPKRSTPAPMETRTYRGGRNELIAIFYKLDTEGFISNIEFLWSGDPDPMLIPLVENNTVTESKIESDNESKIESGNESKIESGNESKIVSKIESDNESKIASKIESNTESNITSTYSKVKNTLLSTPGQTLFLLAGAVFIVAVVARRLYR